MNTVKNWLVRLTLLALVGWLLWWVVHFTFRL